MEHSGRRSAWCQETLKQNNTLSPCQWAILLSSFELIARPNSDTYAHAGCSNHSSLGTLTVVCHPCCHDNQALIFWLGNCQIVQERFCFLKCTIRSVGVRESSSFTQSWISLRDHLVCLEWFLYFPVFIFPYTLSGCLTSVLIFHFY